MTAPVKPQPAAVAIVVDFILNLGARDRVIARGAQPPRAVTGSDLSRQHHWQAAALNELADQEPERGVAQPRFDRHELPPKDAEPASCELLLESQLNVAWPLPLFCRREATLVWNANVSCSSKPFAEIRAMLETERQYKSATPTITE